jgi:hypothetical protein
MEAYKTSRGHWQINYRVNGKQQMLYLGKNYTAASAAKIARIISDIITLRSRHESFPFDLIAKIDSLPNRIRDSLDRQGLLGGHVGVNLDTLIKAFLETKKGMSQDTQNTYKRQLNFLLEHFGKERKISSIDTASCLRFKADKLSFYSPASRHLRISAGLLSVQQLRRKRLVVCHRDGLTVSSAGGVCSFALWSN